MVATAMRVFTAALATETNTFGPMPTGLKSFRDRGYFKAGTHPDVLTFFAGPLWAARQRGRELGWTVVEGMVAAAQPSGITTREAWDLLREELLADLRAAMPVDMVVLGLHGAMVADGCDDCEGELLRQVRAIVGPKVVVGAELDLHNHLTDAMVTNADLLISFKEYPHIDIAERAFELVDLCAATVRGEIRPQPAVADTGSVLIIHTTREPARGYVDRMQALEGKDGVLSVSLTHGFPWGDVPEMGTKLLVYTDAGQDPGGARGCALAQRLADELMGLRQALQPEYLGIDAAIDAALAEPGAGTTRGPVVLADKSDNPGGGAAGDSTFILRRLVERGVVPAALGPLWDPLAVYLAFDAGVGARLPMRLGGKIGPMSGDPLDVQCTVRALKSDMWMTGLAGTPLPLGDCALVDAQGVLVVLITLRNQAMGTDLFTQLGVPLERQRAVVVKSSQHFHAAYAPLASKVLYVDAPGSVSTDLRALPFTKVPRSRLSQ